MAKTNTGGRGLNLTAKLSVSEAIKAAQLLKKELAGIAGVTIKSVAPDTRAITAAKTAQDALRKTLLEGQVAAQRLRNENIALRNSFNEGRISAQQLAAAERQVRSDRRALADATRTARTAQVAANGSYDQANQKLRDLGRSIKAAENGFRSNNPVIQAQIAEYNKLNKSIKAFDAQMGNHQRNVGNYPAGINGIVDSLKGLALTYLSLQGVMQAAGYAFEQALNFDAVRTSLAFTLKGTDEANKKMKELSGTADRLGLDFGALTSSYASFAGAARAANFPLATTNKIFDSVSGAAARFHLTSDQLRGSLLAIQQMISKGTVQSEELRGQLGERLPGAFSIAARAMGVTEMQLGKLLKNGVVLASDLLPKLATELDKTFELNKSTRIDSLTASVNRFKNTFSNAVEDNNNITKFFKTVTDGFTGAVSVITKLVNSGSWKEFFMRVGAVGGVLAGNGGLGMTDLADAQKLIKNTGKDDAAIEEFSGASQAKQIELLKTLTTIRDNAYKQAEKGNRADINYLYEQQQLLTKLRGIYQSLNKDKEGIKITKADLDLGSVAEINKRILELKNDALKNPNNKAADIKRIDDLKKRLKELNGPVKAAADTELNARNTLQSKINELTKKGANKQLSADDQEVASVKDKYAKMKEAATKFNDDPANKKRGLRVDGGGLTNARDAELVALNDKQATERLKITLDAQKKLYDDYESYKAQVGEENAKKEYSVGLNNYGSYLESLLAKKAELENGDQKAKGGSDVDKAAVQQQLKLVDEQIVAEQAIKKERERQAFANAYQTALTHSQALLAIDTDYNKAVAALGKDINQEQIDNLKRIRDERIRNESQANAYAKGGFDDLMQNYDAMTRGAITKKLVAIKAGYAAEYKEGKITAEQLANLTGQINEQLNKLDGDNAFNNITKAIKNYRDQVKLLGKDSEGAKNAQKDLFDSIAEGAAATNEVVGALGNSFQQLGIGGEGLQDAFKNIQGVIGGMGTLAKGIASGNPVDIITGSIGFLTSAISLFDHKDKNLQKKIDGYKRELDSLGKAYNDLDRMVSNSVGESIYADQAAQIQNLLKQQARLTQMRDAEIDKKKTDQGKVDEYQAQINAIPGQIEDINKAISANLIQTNFKDLSNSLADAFTEAFSAGEDAAGRFDNVFEKVIANAIKNSLKLKILDPIVKKFTDDLSAYALANNNSIIGFDFSSYKDQLKAAGELFQAGLKGSEEFFKDSGVSVDDAGSALNKSIKGITSDQANALEGITRGTYDLTKQLVVQGQQRGTLIIPMSTTIANLYLNAVESLKCHQQTAANTYNTVEELKRVVFEVKAINANTKAGSLRGAGLGG